MLMHGQISQISWNYWKNSMQWSDLLAAEKQQPYFQKIMQFLADERAKGTTIYPKQSEYFNAFKFTSFENLKVVILGQDPYHGPGQAHGLSFSVPKGVKAPPSLKNIFKELLADKQITQIPEHACLTSWAKQGVLLLNTALSVEAHKAQSHSQMGWSAFTDIVIQQVNQHKQHVVFLLWGSHAQKKQSFIDTTKHTVLCTTHPSPLSAHRGFLGCRHFSKTNAALNKNQQTAIDWQI